MSEFGGALDRYREAPYVIAARDEEDYERWCESKGLDPDDSHWGAFEDARSGEDAAYEERYARFHGDEDTAEGYWVDIEEIGR